MTASLRNRVWRRAAAAAFAIVLAGPAGAAQAACQIGVIADLPVTMMGMRALFPAKINGAPVNFMVDSGAFYSLITPANAAKYNLPLRALPFGLTVTGLTGEAKAQQARVKVFTVANTDLTDIDFIITSGELGHGAVGVLGQNFLGRFDVEYDLARSVVRLARPMDCGDRPLAYWAGDKPWSMIRLTGDDRFGYTSATKGVVYLNGIRMTAEFDTGAPLTTMTMRAAERAGVTPTSPGSVPAGFTGGIGRRLVESWSGRFKSFKIGDEEIQNTDMRFGKVDLENADILIGADFFLSHHIYVSNKQNTMYFTYNGGPVFNLNKAPKEVWSGEPAGGPRPKEQAEPEPTDAAGFDRRGAGFAAREDYTDAIADLTQAVTLAPNNADYLYQRGLAYMASKQPDLGAADFDRAIALRPDHVPALMARARIESNHRERPLVLRDLAAADKASAAQDDVHFQIARYYEGMTLLPEAIAQYDLWIPPHEEDSRLPVALNGRCWARVLLNQDLDKALSDCNKAIRLAPAMMDIFDSRAYVHLRRGELDKAIADFDTVIATRPKSPWSLYGRGLARQRKGLTADGAADIAAAVAIDPNLPDEMKRRGIDTPG